MKPHKIHISLLIITFLCVFHAQAQESLPPRKAEMEEEWGKNSYKRLRVPVNLELVRNGKQINTIRIAQGTVVSAGPTCDRGRIYGGTEEDNDPENTTAHWMGETFQIPRVLLSGLYEPIEEGQATSVAKVDLQTPNGILKDATVAKIYPTSVLIRHADGTTFVNRKDLRWEEQQKLGLGQKEKEPITIRSKDVEYTTLARMTAHLNKFPLQSEPSKHPDEPETPLAFKKSLFADWSTEEVLWYVQKAHASDGKYFAPIEIGALAASESQNPNYYGKDFEKLYSFSLRPQLEKLGIKAVQQDGSNDEQFAAATWLTCLLKLAGRQPKMTIQSLAAYINNTKNKDSTDRTWRGVSNEALPTEIADGVQIKIKNIWESYGSKDGDNKYDSLWEPNQWLRKSNMGARAGFPLINELILYELRSGRPVLASITGTAPALNNGVRTYGGNDQGVVIVGAKIINPQPRLVVEYEFLNSNGPKWGNNGYGKVRDYDITEVVGAELQFK